MLYRNQEEETNDETFFAFLLTLTLLISCIPAARSADKQFVDIRSNDRWYSAVDFAYSHRLFNGVTETHFGPKENMTRAMFVAVLGRMSGVPENKDVTTVFRDVKKGKYYTGYVRWASDADQISDYAKDAVKQCQNGGLFRGEKTENGYRFRPKDHVIQE